MATALTTEHTEGVTAPLQFTTDTGEPPVALVKVPGAGLDDRLGQFAYRDVFIEDGRPRRAQFTLDGDGFALLDDVSATKDFYDDDEVRRVYYPEMEKLIIRESGASKVVIFDHTARIDDRAAQDARKIRPPAVIVHNDFTEQSAEQRVRDLLPPDQAEALLQKRFGSINVWRPIRSPVETAPLAICGYNDIVYEDLILSERHYPDGRIGRIYHLAYNPAQKWIYYPHMTRDEVVLLKCYDSKTDGTARWTAHGSFQDPTSRGGAAPRESIEIRSMVFYD